MVRHSTARQKFCSYKTEESLQVEPQSNSNFYGSARRGAARLIKRALQFLREVKRPLPIVVVLCEESPYDLIKILGLFSVILRS